MTISRTATVHVFLRAFRSLTKPQRHAFLNELLHDKTYRQDLLDAALVEARRHEPGRPLREYLADRVAGRFH